MNTIQLKFLLKLLGHENYKAKITQIQPNSNTSATERDRVCQDLSEQGLVAYTAETLKFKLTPLGQDRLQNQAADPPLSEAELKILQASAKKTTTPAATDVPARERQVLIQTLATHGLVKVEKRQIKEVWLTESGATYLQEYTPDGSPTISLAMVGHYLQFLRQTLPSRRHQDQFPSVGHGGMPPIPDIAPVSQLSDIDLLQTIQALDQALGTNNHLPMFHLRQKVKSRLTREELDQALLRLQQHNHIKLTPLEGVNSYTPDQIAAGIPEPIGGPLFFITVRENTGAIKTELL